MQVKFFRAAHADINPHYAAGLVVDDGRGYFIECLEYDANASSVEGLALSLEVSF